MRIYVSDPLPVTYLSLLARSLRDTSLSTGLEINSRLVNDLVSVSASTRSNCGVSHTSYVPEVEIIDDGRRNKATEPRTNSTLFLCMSCGLA